MLAHLSREAQLMEEELEVLNAIYEGCVEPWTESIFLLHIPDTDVTVRLAFPKVYPDAPPWVVTVTGVSSKSLLGKLQNIIDSNFVAGEVFLYTFLDECKQLLSATNDIQSEPLECTQQRNCGSQFIDQWFTSEEIIDRKSKFIARCLGVHSEQNAIEMIEDLLKDKKLRTATHNIQAWRIKRDDGLMNQNCDDDGESAAGSRLLHLLNITNCVDVVVVVSRWYGGINLGPDRFKHINQCARDALAGGNFIK